MNNRDMLQQSGPVSILCRKPQDYSNRYPQNSAHASDTLWVTPRNNQHSTLLSLPAGVERLPACLQSRQKHCVHGNAANACNVWKP